MGKEAQRVLRTRVGREMNYGGTSAEWAGGLGFIVKQEDEVPRTFRLDGAEESGH